MKIEKPEISEQRRKDIASKAIYALAMASPKRNRMKFFYWLRPRLGAHDWAGLVSLDLDYVKSQDAKALYREWCGAAKK